MFTYLGSLIQICIVCSVTTRKDWEIMNYITLLEFAIWMTDYEVLGSSNVLPIALQYCGSNSECIKILQALQGRTLYKKINEKRLQPQIHLSILVPCSADFDGMGFDLTRFQGEVDEELLCPICSEVLEEPLQVSCFHSPGLYVFLKLNQSLYREYILYDH